VHDTSQVDSGEYQWDRYVRSAERLGSVTREDVLALFDAALAPSARRRRLDVHVYGNKHPMPPPAAAAAAGDTAAAAASGDGGGNGGAALELTPEQLGAFRAGLEMLETSVVPQAALRAYTAASAAAATE
jgi:hypothetical protein